MKFSRRPRESKMYRAQEFEVRRRSAGAPKSIRTHAGMDGSLMFSVPRHRRHHHLLLLLLLAAASWSLQVVLPQSTGPRAATRRMQVAVACTVNPDGLLQLDVAPGGEIVAVRSKSALGDAVERQLVAMTVLRGAAIVLRNTTVQRCEVGVGSCCIKRQYSAGISTEERLVVGEGPHRVLWSLNASWDRAESPRRLPVSVRTELVWGDWSDDSRWWSPVNTDVMSASPQAAEPWGPKVLPQEAEIYEYGGDRFSQNSAVDPVLPGTGGSGATRGLTIPIVTRLDGTDADGISFMLASPSAVYDDTAHAALTVSPGNTNANRQDTEAVFAFDRRWLSVGGSAKPLKLSGTWAAHAGCWRPALGAFFEEFPFVAQPDDRTLPRLPELQGAASYMYYFDQPQMKGKSHYEAMDLRVNWGTY